LLLVLAVLEEGRVSLLTLLAGRRLVAVAARVRSVLVDEVEVGVESAPVTGRLGLLQLLGGHVQRLEDHVDSSHLLRVLGIVGLLATQRHTVVRQTWAYVLRDADVGYSEVGKNGLDGGYRSGNAGVRIDLVLEQGGDGVGHGDVDASCGTVQSLISQTAGECGQE